jgi:hypothetical protein
MKIENPTIISALKRAAYIANVTPSNVLDYYLAGLVSSLENSPLDPLIELVSAFRHEDQVAAEVAAGRLAEFAAGEHIEGRTQFTVDCEVVEGDDGFEVMVERLHPKRKRWESALGIEDQEDGADWWKQSS